MAVYKCYVEKQPELFLFPKEGVVHATVRQIWFKTHKEMESWLSSGNRRKEYSSVCPPKPLEL